jgi:hypothetical protein
LFIFPAIGVGCWPMWPAEAGSARCVGPAAGSQSFGLDSWGMKEPAAEVNNRIEKNLLFSNWLKSEEIHFKPSFLKDALNPRLLCSQNSVHLFTLESSQNSLG